MAAVVQGVAEVAALIGQPPVVVGGLAVMCRLSSPYRATTVPAEFLSEVTHPRPVVS